VHKTNKNTFLLHFAQLSFYASPCDLTVTDSKFFDPVKFSSWSTLQRL